MYNKLKDKGVTPIDNSLSSITSSLDQLGNISDNKFILDSYNMSGVGLDMINLNLTLNSKNYSKMTIGSISGFSINASRGSDNIYDLSEIDQIIISYYHAGNENPYRVSANITNLIMYN